MIKNSSIKAEEAVGNNTEEDDEEILPANSPLGLYAAEVGLSEAVTHDLQLADNEIAPPSEEKNGIFYEENRSVGALEYLSRLLVSRVVASNAASLRRLLDEDDMRLLLLALSETHKDTGLGIRLLRQCLFVSLPVLLLVFAVLYRLVTEFTCFLVISVGLVAFLIVMPWLFLRVLSRWFASLLIAVDRCLGNQRACLRLARERLQVERGFTLIRGTSGSAETRDPNGLKAPALNHAAFESARRLTHSIRQLARSVELGGLASLTDDAEFGEAFKIDLTLSELTLATDGFAPTALASMAGLLQMHLSDVLLRLLLALAGCSHGNRNGYSNLILLLSSIASLKRELLFEVGELEIRLDRHRRREASDVDTLLEEFLGTSASSELSLKSCSNDNNSVKTTPLQAAARSLRLQAEALLVKAAIAERSASNEDIDMAELAAEARVYATNAVACCDEIEMALKPSASKQSASEPTLKLPSSEEIDRPVVLVSSADCPVIEDEFLEGLVPESGNDPDADKDSAAIVDDKDQYNDEATRRAATRRVLGELDSVILQRRRLFRQREQAARMRRGLPPLELEGDDDIDDKTVEHSGDSSDSRPRCRRRIVWHGDLEGDGDGEGGSQFVKPQSLLASIGASPSTFAAAALAARRVRGIQLNEEAFGDDEDAECDGDEVC